MSATNTETLTEIAKLKLENAKLEVEIQSADFDLGEELLKLREKNIVSENNDRGYANFHLTDLGNAKRFVADHKSRIRFVPGWGWLYYDGCRWVKDDTGEIMRLAKQTVFEMYVEAMQETDYETRKNLMKHCITSEGEADLRRLVELGKTEIEVVATVKKFDTDPFLFNCTNGTIDLRTGTIKPHEATNFITKLCPVTYDPSATCPTWSAFVYKIMGGDRELIKFKKRMTGYILTGDVSEQCLFIFYGLGANGKSVEINTIKRLLGAYAMSASADTFLIKKSGGIPNDIARLVGARLVTVVETDLNKKMAEGLIKSVTGNDTIAVRFLYKEFFETRLIMKLIIVTNHKPHIVGRDYAIWRRIRLTPYTVTIPPSEQDKHLETKLAAELPGILAWAVQGCLEWQREGLGIPQAVADATAAYKAEMASNVTAFINDQYDAGTTIRERAKEFYINYMEWCTSIGEEPVSQKIFKTNLLDMGLTQKRTSKNGGIEWHGLVNVSPTEVLKPTETNFSNFYNIASHGDLYKKRFSNTSVFSNLREGEL